MPRDVTPSDSGSDEYDEVVAEVRAIRHRLAAAVDFDVDRLFDQVNAIEAEERLRGRVIVSPAAGNTGAARPRNGRSVWSASSVGERTGITRL
ncbi:MAG: hypothetical protein ABI877_05285 [Gemmatimonadaceae bacterium]